MPAVTVLADYQSALSTVLDALRNIQDIGFGGYYGSSEEQDAVNGNKEDNLIINYEC